MLTYFCSKDYLQPRRRTQARLKMASINSAFDNVASDCAVGQCHFSCVLATSTSFSGALVEQSKPKGVDFRTIDSASFKRDAVSIIPRANASYPHSNGEVRTSVFVLVTHLRSFHIECIIGWVPFGRSNHARISIAQFLGRLWLFVRARLLH